MILNTGEEVPADSELLEATSLHMDESTLTGEPVCGKSVDEKISTRLQPILQTM